MTIRRKTNVQKLQILSRLQKCSSLIFLNNAGTVWERRKKTSCTQTLVLQLHFITIVHIMVFSDFLPDYLIYPIKHTSSVHVNVLTVCRESWNSHATPLWTGVESAGQSDISAWESCSFDIPALMWTPSLCPQVWVESWILEQERGVEWYRMREHEEVTHM